MLIQFKNEIGKLIGKNCWGVVAGQGNGSMVTLHIGEKVKRSQPLRNEKLSQDLRVFQGEFCVFIKGCSWRFEHTKCIKCSWRQEENVLVQALKPFNEGLRILKITAKDVFLDLAIEFENQYSLFLFCDQMPIDQGIDNYSIRTPSGWFTVGPKNVLSFEATKLKKEAA
ncbi:MAG: hypothetical protein MRJ65_12380 [Candidatus Brocadiaceae bacterium]|nr:hypothetical protein [Candidatus Brocadiaceae bacterium]